MDKRYSQSTLQTSSDDLEIFSEEHLVQLPYFSSKGDVQRGRDLPEVAGLLVKPSSLDPWPSLTSLPVSPSPFPPPSPTVFKNWF